MEVNSASYRISGQVTDVVSGTIFPGELIVENGRIAAIERVSVAGDRYILPGLIDAHVHIESSMLLPSEFARLAVVHGTTATVSDPHEIANVLGMEGVKFMIRNGKKVPFRFFFGAPSCVPATGFETSGACLGPAEVEEMLSWPEILYLAEMMNFPGVLHQDGEVMAKLAAAAKYGKPVDGHAPGVLGEDARRYAAAGISTDHECFSREEALDKIRAGMKILIREGSAARNFDELIGLIKDYPEMIMFCSDDKHPDDLINGHINLLIKRALKSGYELMDVLRACTLNPVRHYGLDAGLLQPGDKADFIIIDHPEQFNVLATFVDGIKVAEHGKSLIDRVKEESPNAFNAMTLSPGMLSIEAVSGRIKVQQALAGQLITEKKVVAASISDGMVVSDPKRDILKMIVMNRYSPAEPAMDFVSGFGLKRGAIASTVAHDSHNIIAVGADDASIVRAVNMLVEASGGIACVEGPDTQADDGLILPLPVAGIMSAEDGYTVAENYKMINRKVRNLGSSLDAPFMTLSFMALLVIPALKLSDKGLFDGNTFGFTTLFE
ncbi:adenine deaminase [Lentimicrobium saccharophilum]|uniref:Adenine deaminase n=1 Tax=Lentimicrobium saccharophilum TaxID=1678841 RepID=A0A0S7BY54_9BACT|nr:adenine deaminase [Lentimicrobium saccharophilum]GAP43431.1 adenine deaminase [Lentimicrobium saccharophilum]